MVFEKLNCLGSRSYFIKNSVNSELYSCFPFSDGMYHIDPVGVLGVVMKNYALSDRTMVKEVKRLPFMISPSDGRAGDEPLPIHGNLNLSSNEIASNLKDVLREEALAFIEGKKNIGILLSGGMDSRVVAAIIRQLQEDGSYSGDVVALTWGLDCSRDVVYAQRIAERFGWGFRHFPLDADVLRQNIIIAADQGAEYSPVHLHAMGAVSQTQGLDGVLAGSYGDSIGRGEYSGRRVNKLPYILDKHLNHFAFMLRSIEQEAMIAMKADLARDRARFPGRTEMAYREIEMQMHYMRRQLNACMGVIDDNIPLHQMFGSPKVFGFMWSLAPACRNDENYESLLKILPGNLLDIPWSRTGSRYNQFEKTPEDSYSKRNNSYGEWLRNDLREFVLHEINCGALQSLGVFNDYSLAMWSKHWPTSHNPQADRLDEKMAWLASLSLFVKKYNIKGVESPTQYIMADRLAQAKAFSHTKLYHTVLGMLKR